MNKKAVAISTGITVVVAVILILLLMPAKPVSNIEEYYNYISAYTSGIVSRETNIRVRLTQEYPQDKKILPELFAIDPSVDGAANWVDGQTIEFTPSEILQPDQTYRVSFNLGKIIKTEAGIKPFVFEFSTIKRSFSVDVTGIESVDSKTPGLQRITGYIETSDIENISDIKQVLSASINGCSLQVNFLRGQGNKFIFDIDSISRGEDPKTVNLEWNGSKIGIEESGKKNVEIPALGDFKVLSANVVSQPDQYITVRFSDPIKPDQNLNGLITLNDNRTPNFEISGNEVKVYPAQRLFGEYTLNIARGVRNSLNYKLKETFDISLSFENLKPQVQFVNKGIIIPNTGSGFVLPFEAVNLSAVDVMIIKIFENNVSQFLQINTLEGEYELNRVGKTILRKTIDLRNSGAVSLQKWNRFSLDLNEIVRNDPGAIYRVKIGFRKSQSLYNCNSGESSGEDSEGMQDISQEDPSDPSYWDYYDNYYEYYDWQHREDPCYKAYYGNRRSIAKNIFASDIGIIAKRGNDGVVNFITTNILTAAPMGDVNIRVLDYQQQQIAELKTDNQGFAKAPVENKPFVAIADYNGQKGYLKMDDGSSLSLSRFDVSGASVNKGVKGFIYGERGVWRPGDSVFISFIFEDMGKNIPDKHPVIFELTNPRQKMVKRIVTQRNGTDFYVFRFNTNNDDPTGDWSAKISVGGVSFYKPLKIETVKPNRLKIKFDLKNDYLVRWSESKVNMKITWLHGAVAKNLKAKVDISLSPSRTYFEKYKDFVFDSPVKKFSSEPKTIFEGEVDSKGETSFNVDLDVQKEAPGKLTANFMTKAFEPGGDFSTDRFSVPYFPYNSYVGIKLPKGDRARGMLLTDTTHKVSLVCLDVDGNPVSRRKIELKFYKANWKWWWDQSEDNVSNYSTGYYQKLLKSDTVITSGSGQAQWNIKVKYPDWGRYLIVAKDMESQHETGKYVYIDWPGWAGRAQKDQGGGASMLTFTADKEKYSVGDEVELSIPSSDAGRALVSIESGSKVVDAFWAEMVKGENKVKFKTTPTMAPNVYANVTLLQPHSQTVNDLPIRLYGIIPILVEDPATHITPVITMPDVLKPEEKVEIKVKEKSGHPMTYTLAIVDDGLLDLTRFKTPDPWNNFYKREALGVKTWDLYDLVIGAYGGRLEYLLGLGGDGEVAKPKEGSKANRFKPMVRFVGPFTSNGSEMTHIIDIPRYVGSVRTMVIAGDKGAYGYADKTTPVRKPLMILGTLPRLLGPLEEVMLPVSVFAMEKNIKDVKVVVEPNDMLETVGGNVKEISFTEPGDELVNFKLKVKPKTGIAKVKITAVSGSEKAQYDIELEVRTPNPSVTKIQDALLEKDSDWTAEFKAFGVEGTNKATLEVSSMPPINLGERLNYLLNYPHGCIEQNTSAVFPQLYLGDLMELTEQQKTRIDQNVKMGINRLVTFQTSGGGLSYWPGESHISEWGTNYAGHFILEAQRKGYSVNSVFLARWKKFQKDAARKWNDQADRSGLVQAYRLYTLALAGEPDLGSMNRLLEMDKVSKTAKFRLAAAYNLAGKNEVAEKIISGLDLTVPAYNELGYTFGSDLRDLAMILETLVSLGKRTEGFEIVKRISNRLSGQYWLSTQETAYSLMAVAKYIGKDSKTAFNTNFGYSVNNGQVKNIMKQNPLAQEKIDIKAGETKKVTIKNNSGRPLFARTIIEGKPAAGDSTDVESNLKLTVTYKLLDGTVIDPSSLEQGTDFMAEVHVVNPGTKARYYEQMELTQIFPSGWEIINTRISGNGNFVESSSFDYQDIRDDRVYTYYSLSTDSKNTGKTFRILLNASYLGKFYLPTVASQAMYDISINARKHGKWVEVVKPGE